MTETKPYDYDIAILGTGIGGSMLGAVLAKNGARVLLIDSKCHPRFSVGESTIPFTLVCLRTISERYGVPEIKNICSFEACMKRVGRSSGIKKHFGFLIHQEGKEPDPLDATQFNTPRILHDSSHYFRQDVDAYLFFAALKYGCDARQNCVVRDVEIRDDGVQVNGTQGERFWVQYVVDCSGYHSPLGKQFGLREEPCRFKHHSRCLFTHMVDVPLCDDVLHHPRHLRPPLPWHTGTMHHMFDGGWFWVIPFNNHPDSLNPLVSVGLTIDNRRWPKPTDITPEEEFFRFADRFPAVARQFRGARTVRPWVSSDRLQYSHRQAVGDRWCMVAHAYGNLDALFSRGLNNTAEVINALTWRLLRALKDGDFSAQRFEYIERLSSGLLNNNDKLVNSAFISFRDYRLWSAVFKIWAWGSLYGTYRMQRALTLFRKTGDPKWFVELESAPRPGAVLPDHDGFHHLFDTMVEQCEGVEAGRIAPAAAADHIYGIMQKADYIGHPMGFSDPEVRFIHPNLWKMMGVVGWALRSPKKQRALFMGVIVELVKAYLKGDRLF